MPAWEWEDCVQKALTGTFEGAFMQRPSRRTILASVAGCGAAVLPGCARIGIGDRSFSYSAAVVEQQSATTPATIRTTLTTDRGESQISARETIVLRYDDGPGYDVLLFPDTDVGPNDPPAEPSEGCWRYTDSDLLARDIEEWHTVDSGDGFRETYRLFTRGADGQCLPDGDYRFLADVRDGTRNELQVVVAVSISDGQVSVDGSVHS